MPSTTVDTTEFLSIEQHQFSVHWILQKPLTLLQSFGYEAALLSAETALHTLLQTTHATEHGERVRLRVDFGSINDYDSYSVVWLASVKRFCAEHDVLLAIDGMNDQMRQFVQLLEKPLLQMPEEQQEESAFHRYVEQIGSTTLYILADARFFIEFIGDFCSNVVYIIFRPRSMRWEDFPVQFLKAGVSALPIVMLIGFLMGIIIGYQGAMQLRQFGADIYLADMVAIAMTRELAPLMTAIIVAGRSGAAFAAEIGTMQVSEEIDALQTMGFNITRFLVMPRVFAVTLAMPFLSLFSAIAGIAGGLLIAVTTLKLSMSGYLHETQYALSYAHLYTGLFKSVILGGIIAIVGCMRGLQVRGGAESVGQYTTASVVTGIFLIILADAFFTVIFQAIGI